MKISQETPEFKPITIVLETHKEVVELYNAICNNDRSPSVGELDKYLKEVIYES